MVLVVEKKNMEGVWWKYGFMLALLHIVAWVLAGYKLNPDLDLLWFFRTSWLLTLIFAAGAYLPFIAMRLGYHRLFWCGLIGFIVGSCSYFLLLFFEPLWQFPGFVALPANTWFQFDLTFVAIGVILELGKYVFKRVFEE